MHVFFILILLWQQYAHAAKIDLKKNQRKKFLADLSFSYYPESDSFRAPNMPSPKQILEGPKNKLQTKLKGHVYCRYFKRRNNGTNPKFRCHLTDNNGRFLNQKGQIINKNSSEKVELKVKFQNLYKKNKYLEKDNFTEVFSSHLLWTLGLATDRMYPTQKVICFDCPLAPFPASKAKIGEVVAFKDAAIELKYPADTLTFAKQKGWSFYEMDKLKDAGELTRKSRTEFQALSLLMSIITHSSNRIWQQRLVCQKSHLNPWGQCQQATAVVQDLGSVLGTQHSLLSLSLSKADLKSWKARKVWHNKKSCELNLLFAGKGLKQKRLKIGELGRKLLLSKLVKLTEDPHFKDKRLRAILIKSKLYLADKSLIKNLKKSPKEIIDMWVEAFKEKIKEVKTTTCHYP